MLQIRFRVDVFGRNCVKKWEKGIDRQLKARSSTVVWRKVINGVRMKVNWGLLDYVVVLCVCVCGVCVCVCGCVCDETVDSFFIHPVGRRVLMSVFYFRTVQRPVTLPCVRSAIPATPYTVLRRCSEPRLGFQEACSNFQTALFPHLIFCAVLVLPSSCTLVAFLFRLFYLLSCVFWID